tara:strand:- start:444 stop:1001 length:558 start_codon:yes stop_codon:yes gene_type:complete
MALKPTIYKFTINLSDLNRGKYETLNLTVAQHPSESVERMMVRVLAYCIDADEHLEFTKGVSAVDEPDLWRHTLDGQLSRWIDVGEPSLERIKKGVHASKNVKIYSLNTKSDVWWNQLENKLSRLELWVYRLEWADVKALAALAQRTMNFSVTISDDSAYIATELGETEIGWTTLKSGREEEYRN